jgi:hypothetical protein
MNLDNDTHAAWLKIVFAWLGTCFGAITMARVSAILSIISVSMVIIFTALQIEKQLRERRRENRLEALEAKLMAPDTTS